MICAVSVVSCIDHVLSALLRSYMAKGDTTQNLLNPVGGKLGELSAKCHAAYCLGLISKGCMENIDRIGLIRNEFAHSVDPLSFKEPTISKLCGQLKPPQATQGSIAFLKHEYGRSVNERIRFILIAQEIYRDLWDEAQKVTHREKKTDRWNI